MLLEEKDADDQLDRSCENKEVLHRVCEEKSILYAIKLKLADWIVRILLNNNRIQHVFKVRKTEDISDGKTRKKT